MDLKPVTEFTTKLSLGCQELQPVGRMVGLTARERFTSKRERPRYFLIGRHLGQDSTQIIKGSIAGKDIRP